MFKLFPNLPIETSIINSGKSASHRSWLSANSRDPSVETIALKNSRFDRENPKTILNLALWSFILFNIDWYLEGGG
jgi:hypothetical protein